MWEFEGTFIILSLSRSHQVSTTSEGTPIPRVLVLTDA
jgi:hypothetical protein